MGKYKVAIVGGGPAGMASAIAIGKILKPHEREIVLIEKTDLGEKLLLTGGGRSNIANSRDIKEQLLKFNISNKNFLKHSFYTFTNNDLLNIFKEKGLEFKQEQDGRYFPINGDANSILKILKGYLNELKINVQLNSHVKSITKENNEFNINIKDKNNIKSLKVILSTGGISYPKTGSTGEGYEIAKTLKHNISLIKPGLVSFKSNDKNLQKLSGLRLRDVEVSFLGEKNRVRGDVLISHFGLSGPEILNLSNYYNENKAISIDLIPDLTEEELNKKIIGDLSLKGKTLLKNYLKYYLRKRFIDYFLNVIEISEDKKLSNLSKSEKRKIINNLKNLTINLNGVFSRKSAMITCGGVKTDEINPKTMESNIIPGLFFAGELLEPCGLTGGYNLQMAFSTGFLAGKSIAESIK
ncbi:MAG: NAD(P)/FAD-dependent oxidoreductase [Methanobrevibacter sp.]|nr:NAD(P)/FAD-dependent oxidoreductase [Methanobrevibacter sp.]